MNNENTTEHGPSYARKLTRIIRMHGHPVRLATASTIRAAYQHAGEGAKGYSWAVATLALTGDSAADHAAVYTWLGY